MLLTRSEKIKRMVDFVLSSVLLLLLALPMAIIALFVRLTSKGPAIYWSSRVGFENKLFQMPKYRTMRLDTPAVATHLLKDPHSYLTWFGVFLRKYSLDELPQLWCVLRGEMSFVGPRPALFNQDDLVAVRSDREVHKIRPGITGWAQVNGRDDLPIPEKVKFDEYYLHNKSLFFDFKIICITFLRVLRSEGVRH